MRKSLAFLLSLSAFVAIAGWDAETAVVPAPVTSLQQNTIQDHSVILTGRARCRCDGQPVSGDFAIRFAMMSPAACHPLCAQLILDGREAYSLFIGWDRDTREIFGEWREWQGGVNAAPDGGKLLEYLNLRVDDAASGFLYWPILEEADAEVFRDKPCRVVVLEEYDSDWYVAVSLADERPVKAVAEVWLDRETGCPLKAVFYRSRSAREEGEKPERVLEFAGWEAHDGIWTPTGFTVSAGSLLVQIDFPAVAVERIGYDRMPVADDFIAQGERNRELEAKVAAEVFRALSGGITPPAREDSASGTCRYTSGSASNSRSASAGNSAVPSAGTP